MICQALADCADNGKVSAFGIGDLAGVVAEIELAAVAAEMRFAHVVIGADHTALEDGEEIFSRVAVLETARNDVFLHYD